MLEFGFVVVGVDFEPEPNLFEDGLYLVSTCFLRFLSGFVFELPEVHNFDNGWFRFRSYFDKVEVSFARNALCDLERDDANLFAERPDESDLGNADALVNSRIGDMCLLWCCVQPVIRSRRTTPQGNIETLTP
jgi:hypothetical protein